MSHLSYKTLFIILLFLLIPIVFLLKVNQKTAKSYAAWWNESWMYRQSINISSHTSAENNVYISTTINIGDTKKTQNDAGDFRFISSTGELYSYYIVSGAGTTAITFHVQLDSFPSGAQTIYAYYGNSSIENGFNTSDFSTEASNYTIGSLGSEETGGAPVAWWKFDEGVGTTTHDSSPNNSHGSLSGATWATSDQCISGTCLYFNGTNASVGLSSFPSNITYPYTVSLWFKPQKLSATQTLFSLYGSNIFPQFNLQGNNRLLAYSGNEKYRYSSKTFTNSDLNQWFFVTFIVADSSTLSNWKVYVNGSNSSGTTGGNTGTYYDPAAPGAIGKLSSSQYFQGYIDDVKIYPYARSASQILQDYNISKSGQSSSNSINTSFGSSSLKSLSDGLVGYWKFDEGTGTSVTDYSSYGQNLSIYWKSAINPSPWGTGKWGYAFQDAGYEYSNDEKAGTTWKAPTLTDFTISLWFNPSSTAPLTTSNGYIISRWWGDCSDSYPPGWAINYSYSTKKIDFKIAADNCGPDGNLSTGASFSPNTWYHLVATHKTGESIKMYINGILDSQTSYTLGLNSSAPQLSFGCGANNNNCGYPGLTDETRIYNRVLTTDEIQQLYKYSPNPSSHSSPIAWYKFDEGVGTSAYDSSGNGNNSVWYGSGNHYSIGKYGKAALFNGINDYLSSDINTNSLTTATTFSFWFNPSSVSRTALVSGYAGANPSSNRWDIQMNRNSDNGIGFVSHGSGVYNNTTTVLQANNWYFLTIVHDIGNSKVYTYLNGKLEKTGTIIYPLNTSVSLKIGNGDGGYYPGLIDELKIYNYALSEDEIKTDYNQSSSFVFGSSNQTIGGTTTSLDYCVPGSTDYCASPVGEWKFEEGTGTTAYDTSGNNHNGIFGPGSSAPTWITGKIGKALNFNGTNYIGLGNNLAITGNITVNVWIKTNSSGTNKAIVAKYGNSGSYTWRIAMDTTGHIIFNRALNGVFDTSVTSNKIINDNNWHHITATFDSTNMKLYIDGQYDNQTAETRTSEATNIWNACIGDDGYTCGNTYGYAFWTGLIDQIRIYNYARTPAQVAYDYNKGAPVAHWKLDECQGSVVHDSSGLGNTGAITIGAGGSQVSLGTCSLGETTAWGIGATGKFNSAVNLDGTDDYVTITNSNSLKFGSKDFSLSFWTYRTGAGSNFGSYISKGAYTIGFDSYDNIFRVNTNTGELAHVSLSPTQNIWQNHIFIVTQLSTPYIKHYINGVLNNSGYTEVGNLGTFNSDNYDIRLGYSSAGGVNRYYAGKIDDVRIYNYALTQQQIDQIYNGGAINFN